jgi:hypothetical protein
MTRRKFPPLWTEETLLAARVTCRLLGMERAYFEGVKIPGIQLKWVFPDGYTSLTTPCSRELFIKKLNYFRSKLITE